MSEEVLLWVLISILIGEFVVETLLDLLNMPKATHKVPLELQGVYSDSEYERSKKYHRTLTSFGLLQGTLGLVTTVIVLSTGLLGWLDGLVRTWSAHPYLPSLLFFGIIYLASDLGSLPFRLYRTFVIEERFGFNKTTVQTFVLDKLKGYVLTSLFGGGILFLFLWLVDWLGPNFWMVFWATATLFLFFINMLYGALFIPLFNKLTPLPQGELREAIEKYAQGVNFPLTQIFVMDGSKRSSKSNAFFTGFGKSKRVVFYDTLIDNHSVEELVAIMAHEVGHYKKRHIVTGFLFSILQIGAILWALSFFIQEPAFSKTLGGKDSAIHLNLIVFALLLTPITKVTGLSLNYLSRKNEFEADAYARETSNGKALMDALKTLSEKNLSNLNPHPAYVAFHYSHPPLAKRLREIQRNLG